MRLRKYMIFGVLLFMVVGFAAVSVTLNFKGIAAVTSNEDDFKVSFTRANLDGEDVAPTTISTDGLTLKYVVEGLKYAGEKSVMDFAITNNSKQYDAKMSLKCDDVTVENTELTIDLDVDRINSGENVLGKIILVLNEDYPGDVDNKLDVQMSCKLKLTALERTSTGEDAPDLEDTKYKETILNGADPVLARGLIPVTIDNNGKVTYANINTKWYKYADKQWANAVKLKSNTTNMYNVGNVIKEEDIESYFVWIPRYKYKLWNVDQEDGYIESELESTSPQTVELTFETKSEEASVGTKNGEWLTHPAFTSLDVNGLWVGKFETGYNGATTRTEGYVSSADTSKIIIKPDVYAWTSNNVKNMFYASYNYDRAKDSHMLKNTEWGAVAYLAFSRFGDGPNMWINNHDDYKTGYSELFRATCISTYNSDCRQSGTTSQFTTLYNTEKGYHASTTGNITGIYDMAGGTYEYVAGFISGNYGYSQLKDSDINQYRNYFDIYPADTDYYTYSKGILGDATKEVGPFYWYKDGDGNNHSHDVWNRNVSMMPTTENLTKYGPWVVRGSSNYYGVFSGILAFENKSGKEAPGYGFRIALAIK